MKNTVLFATTAAALLSCGQTTTPTPTPTPEPTEPKVRVTILDITAHKDCDDLLAGVGEFTGFVIVNSETVFSRDATNAFALSDGDVFPINLVKEFDMNAKPFVSIGAGIYENDPPNAIQPIDYSKTFGKSDNYGINAAGTVWSVRNAPSSTCDVEFRFTIEKV
jgi:hypothetical protein